MFPLDRPAGGDGIGWLLIIVPVFLMPTIIACFTKRPHFIRFTLFNVLFGWCYIVWLVLMWKALHPPPKTFDLDDSFVYSPPAGSVPQGAYSPAPPGYSAANKQA